MTKDYEDGYSDAITQLEYAIEFMDNLGFSADQTYAVYGMKYAKRVLETAQDQRLETQYNNRLRRSLTKVN